MIASLPDLKLLVAEGLATRSDGAPITLDFASIGLHVGSTFLRYKRVQGKVSLPFNAETEVVPLDSDGSVEFPPGAGILAASVEMIKMPLSYMGFIQTKGTIARGFVTVHLCDGQIDPGYSGRVTFELVNLSSFAYTIKPGVAIAQLFLHRLSAKLVEGYNGRYQSASEPTSMRILL